MLAQVIRSFGDPTVFETIEQPRPALKLGHVLIEVRASSVNPIDIKIRRGEARSVAPTLPAILGCDVAGIVREVADDVRGFHPGDEVFGCIGGVGSLPGALSDLVAADARLIARRPLNLPLLEAASLPLVAITGLEAIDRVSVRDRRVLVHGGTGGVGHVLLQLARHRGAAEVWVTGSTPDKRDMAIALGADGAIDYRRTRVRDYVEAHAGGRGFDVVFDTVGGDNLQRSFEAAAPEGQVVALTLDTGPDLSTFRAKALSLHAISMLLPMIDRGLDRARFRRLLDQVRTLVEEGHLRPLIDRRRFSFDHVGEAHAYAESGEQAGKVVLVHA